MGAFDYITTNHSLPPGYEYAQDLLYQTKSLDCTMDDYVLGEDGKLYIRIYNYRPATDEEKADYADKLALWYKNLNQVPDIAEAAENYTVRDGTFSDVLSSCDIEGNSLNFYTNCSDEDGKNVWLEFNAHFYGDVLQYIEPGKRMTAKPSHTTPNAIDT